ncbi:flippase [sulfur-oxidizing endosymbiont of Gigantopelta aegis]|uniref:flippase n=1 Tax=sulfur-oxidizing endosymbiont of Gigantopelta aegis TaxID=2794934 RepID=UPI0018DB466B|nr:flippase [sulfur-oxidizing endosymbiont of Gigantopelta aegis]
MKKQLLNNLSWLFIDKVIRFWGGLIVGIWIARYLGPYDFGVLNYAIAYTTLFLLFVKLGLNQIVVREIVKKPKLTNFLLGTAFLLKFFGSVIAVLSIIISLCFVDMDSVTKVVIVIISLGFIFQTLDVIDFYYQARILSKYVVITRDSAFILSLFLKIYFIVYEYSIVYFAVAYLIDFLLSGLFLLMIFINRGGKILDWRFSKKIAIRLIKLSWTLALASFLIAIYMKIDQVMIGSMLDAEQVGIYSVAVRLSEFWLFIPGIMISTFMPYLVSLRETNNKLYYFRLMQLYSLMFWMGIFIGIVVLFFGEGFIVLLFGEVYEGAYSALVYNIWSGIAISHGMVRGIWLICENLQKYRLYSIIISVTLNVIMNYILIPLYGIDGAAIATLLTQSLSVWLFSFLWKPLRSSTLMMMEAINPMFFINFRK